MKSSSVRYARTLLALSVFLVVGFAGAQPCIRVISTNPTNPVNTTLTSLGGPYSGKINPWLNSFSLFTPTDPIPSIVLNPNAQWGFNSPPSGFLLTNPYSPAHGNDFIRGVQFTHSTLDRFWEDGWELMWMNTGYFPNGERIDVANANRVVPGVHPPAHDQIPYIVQYNRYTGKLRVFAMVHGEFNNSSFNDVRMQLFYPKSSGVPSITSGIFRSLGGYDQALDRKTIFSGTSIFNKNPNNNTLWMYGDIQLSYDPCVCQFQTGIQFNIYGLTTTVVNLYGRSISAQMPLQDANGNPTYTNFLSNTEIGEEFENGGSALYGSFDKLLTDYNAELNKYNSSIKQYNAPMNTMMRQLIGATKDAVQAAGAGFVPQGAISDFVLRQKVRIGEPNEADTSTAKGFAKALSDGSKGVFGKGFDYLTVTAFGDDFFKEPQRPSMPTATFQEMRIKGELTQSTPTEVTTFLTPGSYKYAQVLTPFNYPAYDNPVGLYALLRSPSIKAGHDENAETSSVNGVTHRVEPWSNGPGDVFIYDTSYHYVNQHELGIRLNDKLLYKLNNALDFDRDKTQLYVSFEVEYENTDVTANQSTSYDPTLNLNMKSDDFYLLRATAPFSGKNMALEFSTKWIKIEEVSAANFNLKFAEEYDWNSRPYYVPQAQYGPYFGASPLPRPNGKLDLKVKKIKMKIVADMYFDQLGANGVQNNTFQVFTYLLFDDDQNVDEIEDRGIWVSSPQAVSQFNAINLVLNNEVIEPTDPFITGIQGNTLYVGASSIEIVGNLSVAPNYEAVLQAKFWISSDPNSVINPEIKLMEITQEFVQIEASKEADAQELDDFCAQTQTGYRAWEPQTSFATMPDDTVQGAERKELIEMTVYPNPTSRLLFVESNSSVESTYAFELFTIQGKLLLKKEILGTESPRFELDLNGLMPGTYLLRIHNEKLGYSTVEKIIKMD